MVYTPRPAGVGTPGCLSSSLFTAPVLLGLIGEWPHEDSAAGLQVRATGRKQSLSRGGWEIPKRTGWHFLQNTTYLEV